MKIITPEIEERIKAIGYYQIAGGLFGFYFVLQGFIQETTLGGLQILFYVAAFALFSFSVYCGNLLRKLKVKGLQLSTINQLLQVVNFSMSTIAFSYYSGLRIAVGVNFTKDLIPDFGLSLSGILFKYNSSDLENSFLLINLLPLIIIYLLDRIDYQINFRKELIEASEVSY